MTQPVHVKWARENMMNRDKYDTMSMENQGGNDLKSNPSIVQ